MRISIMKVGQDVIFDRSDSRVDRSNANGNVGLHKIVKMMNDILSESHELFMLSGNDISRCNDESINIIDYKDNPEEAVKMSDVIVVIAGLSTYEKNDRVLEVISSSCKPVVLLCEDPRCYRSMEEDGRFADFNVKLLLWQTYSDSFQPWSGKFVRSKYFPLQVASAYEHDESSMPSFGDKDVDFIVSANTSLGGGSKYDRVKILAGLLQDQCNISVYGRLSVAEKSMLWRQDCIGEVKYDEMQSAMRSASSMLLVPIEEAWVTSKYVECLMNNVLPIFYADYEVSLVTDFPLVKVYGCRDLDCVLDVISKHERFAYEYASMLYDELVRPYVDGTLLMSMLVEELKKVACSD